MSKPRMRAVLVIVVAALAGAATARALEPGFAPGNYIPEGGTGWMEVKPADGDGAFAFSIEAYGTNGHTCSLEGRILGGVATLDTDEGKEHCVVGFRAVDGGVEVVRKSGPCHYFCGFRANFEDVYWVPAAGCDDASREATRKKFKRLYDRKRYAQALAELSPLPAACAKTLHWVEEGGIANDLAITQYRLGMREQCLKTLAPYAEHAALSDDEVLAEFGYAPADAESYLSIVKSARFNLNLCRKP